MKSVWRKKYIINTENVSYASNVILDASISRFNNVLKHYGVDKLIKSIEVSETFSDFHYIFSFRDGRAIYFVTTKDAFSIYPMFSVILNKQLNFTFVDVDSIINHYELENFIQVAQK